MSARPWSRHLAKKAFNSPTGFNTPFDISILIQQLCDHGDFLETQADRARNTITAFGRMGGNVVGFVANNSAVASGQIDIDAAYKNARFIRFCNLYNIPVIFLEDTTGFLPGREQEHRGIVQAGRAMLDAILTFAPPAFWFWCVTPLVALTRLTTTMRQARISSLPCQPLGWQ